MSFQIIPIPERIANEVRQTQKSPQYGHPAFTDIAKGYGPCRACLQTFDENREERTLFTYNPFEGVSDLPAPSPIYIHTEACKLFTEKNTFPDDLRGLPLLFESYGENGDFLRREKVGENPENQITQLLDKGEIKFINLRNGEAGCFVARIECA